MQSLCKDLKSFTLKMYHIFSWKLQLEFFICDKCILEGSEGKLPFICFMISVIDNVQL